MTPSDGASIASKTLPARGVGVRENVGRETTACSVAGGL
jgi:hypothetical protein